MTCCPLHTQNSHTPAYKYSTCRAFCCYLLPLLLSPVEPLSSCVQPFRSARIVARLAFAVACLAPVVALWALVVACLPPIIVYLAPFVVRLASVSLPVWPLLPLVWPLFRSPLGRQFTVRSPLHLFNYGWTMHITVTHGLTCRVLEACCLSTLEALLSVYQNMYLLVLCSFGLANK